MVNVCLREPSGVSRSIVTREPKRTISASGGGGRGSALAWRALQ
jgi:hypothetical protein